MAVMAGRMMAMSPACVMRVAARMGVGPVSMTATMAAVATMTVVGGGRSVYHWLGVCRM